MSEHDRQAMELSTSAVVTGLESGKEPGMHSVFVVRVWPTASKRGKPQMSLLGDTADEALRATAKWFEEGCPSMSELEQRTP